jgi:hypothetical protein
MSGGTLFPGSNQKLQFNKVFRSFLNEHSQLVHTCGCDPDLLYFHSLWKGAITFLSSSSTVGPTFGAIHQRAGWSQGKVNATYILFEREGDQFIGRILAGLHIHKHTFTVLSTWLRVQGAADDVSFCVFVNLVFVPFLYVIPSTNTHTCFAILHEAITKLMERVYTISPGTPRPLICHSQVSSCFVFAP